MALFLSIASYLAFASATFLFWDSISASLCAICAASTAAFVLCCCIFAKANAASSASLASSVLRSSPALHSSSSLAFNENSSLSGLTSEGLITGLVLYFKLCLILPSFWRKQLLCKLCCTYPYAASIRALVSSSQPPSMAVR
ncbi:hypothetical protein CFOL_v3_28374 [Cephalotus follicularis]|uniref:Uncharacterized protein n=1 Tax=Cephalotus follicularis TaxID=3775 RepID=A0A1Q3CXM2_CEPFO|nr:hypothetical protein CFOL_v3_28374 [Cephalotus follicularis]